MGTPKTGVGGGVTRGVKFAVQRVRHGEFNRINILLCYVTLCYYSYMQTTIYIRKENEDKWTSFGKDKSKLVNEWLSGQITTNSGVENIQLHTADKPQITFTNKPIDIPGVQVGIADGLPCCSKRVPCKHWSWNSDLQVYINSLTGEQKEAEWFHSSYPPS